MRKRKSKKKAAPPSLQPGSWSKPTAPFYNSASARPAPAPAAPRPAPRPTPPPSNKKDSVDEMISEALIEEMRVRDLNEASKIVVKEDFYGFINAGNNIIRTFEDNNKTLKEAKKYMKYLLAHNIM